MADYSIFADISRYLLELLREAICPSLLSSREQIAVGAPDDSKSDAQLLLYMYSIRDFDEYIPERGEFLYGGMTANRPLPVMARYVAYMNKHAQAPVDELSSQRLLGRVMQALNSNPVVDIRIAHPAADSMDEPVTVLFSKLDDHQKRDLWSGFSEPMRPAVYFELGPLLINGGAKFTPRVTGTQSEVKRL